MNTADPIAAAPMTESDVLKMRLRAVRALVNKPLRVDDSVIAIGDGDADGRPPVAETMLRVVAAARALVDALTPDRDALTPLARVRIADLDAALSDFHGLKAPDPGGGGPDAR